LVVLNIISCDIVELLLTVFFGVGKFYLIIFQPENMDLKFHLEKVFIMKKIHPNLPYFKGKNSRTLKKRSQQVATNIKISFF
jgi:hypothetical protein